MKCPKCGEVVGKDENTCDNCLYVLKPELKLILSRQDDFSMEILKQRLRDEHIAFIEHKSENAALTTLYMNSAYSEVSLYVSEKDFDYAKSIVSTFEFQSEEKQPRSLVATICLVIIILLIGSGVGGRLF